MDRSIRFYMLMLIENLGRDYIVWDKGATIRFRKPGKGTVRAEFRLMQEQLDALRAQIDLHGKIERTFTARCATRRARWSLKWKNSSTSAQTIASDLLTLTLSHAAGGSG